jgi:hypothetical protein
VQQQPRLLGADMGATVSAVFGNLLFINWIKARIESTHHHQNPKKIRFNQRFNKKFILSIEFHLGQVWGVTLRNENRDAPK